MGCFQRTLPDIFPFVAGGFKDVGKPHIGLQDSGGGVARVVPQYRIRTTPMSAGPPPFPIQVSPMCQNDPDVVRLHVDAKDYKQSDHVYTPQAPLHSH